MPIRMVQDDPNSQEEYNPQDENNNDNSQAGGGGFGNMLFVVPILGWLLKRPKFLLIAALLAAAYFFILKPMLNGSSSSKAERTTGANFDAKKYDSTEVYEALDNSELANTALPERVTLERFAPERRNQGEQGSCVAWSSAYAARSIMEAAANNVPGNSIAFSPSYLYNQIHLPNCQGALLPDAMKVMLYKGSVPFKMFPYNQYSCDNVPNDQAHNYASQFKTRGFQRLTVNGNDHKVDLNAIKQNLAAGGPVVIGMMVPRSFMQNMMGEKVWRPESGDDPDYGTMGGHAMCVIGYDDNLEGGAVQIMNSWGPEWGENGFGWIRYKDFLRFNKEAYGLYPLQAKGNALNKQFACNIGLAVDGKQLIPLQSIGSGVFSTTSKVPKGTKFKMYVKNDIECYTYIFGEETNGKVYTLFPYTAKHSPFCGITGVRLFPKDYSMQVDNVGTKDNMAIVTTRLPIDYNNLMRKINTTSGNFVQKVKGALGGMILNDVQYTSDGKFVQFKATAPNENKAVVCVVEVNK
jgi:C1A family cysteine protease